MAMKRYLAAAHSKISMRHALFRAAYGISIAP
jgi:hypothetical protein